MARRVSLWLWSALAGVCVSLDWPYSVVVPQLADEVAQCAKVSGFGFANDTLITAAQAAATCPDPSCIALMNAFFNTATDHADVLSLALTYSRFAMPVIYFCWFFRMPDDICSTDPYNDLDIHLREKDEACARVTGMSVFDSSEDTGNHWLDFYESGELCPQECVDIAKRLEFFGTSTLTTCVVSNDERHSDHMYYKFLMQAACLDIFATDYAWNYAYQPGWPLLITADPPTVEPSTTPTPPTTVSSPVNASITDGSLSPELQDEDEEATVGDATAPSARPTTSQPNRAGSPPTSKPGSTVTSITSTPATSPNPVKRDQPTSPPAADVSTGAERVRTTSPGGQPHDEGNDSSPPSVIQNTDIRANRTLSKLVYVVPTIAIFALCVLFALFKRRRDQAASKEAHEDELYSEITDGPDTNQSSLDPSGMKIAKTLSLNSIQDIRIIGSGGHGVVYLVKDTAHDRMLASKRLAKNHQTNDRIAEFLEEIQLVSTLSHPCIVAFVGATWMHRTDVQALFEYMDGGDLRQHLDQTPVGPWDTQKFSIAVDIADALAYVHAAEPTPIIHRDLKSRNVLLSKSPMRAKISDFGVARQLSQNCSMTTGVGTSRWLAPEVITGGGDYTTACDIYSFGVVLSELDTHALPFGDLRGSDGTALPEITILSMVALEGLRPAISESCPPAIAELAAACMSHDPQQRPTAAVIAMAFRDYPHAAPTGS